MSIENTLWQSCDKLRGQIDPPEYKHVVLGLIFLKFVGDKFEQRKEILIKEGKEKYINNKDFYIAKNIFFLGEDSRWSQIVKKAKQNDIAIIIDTALNKIEKDNPSLKGALPDNYFSGLGLERSKLSALIDKINEIDTLENEEQDIIGRIYEYFLRKFAIKEGKGKGEFYTPKTIVKLITELIEPFSGKIYDPACGSGGLFIQSIKFIDKHQGNKKNISIYGQEASQTTYKLAKMNLAIRGISANLGIRDADTFHNDLHKDLKADFIMANPPFNQKDWREENELVDDPRWKGFTIPQKSNANYAWILNMVSKLSNKGVAGFILANGALNGDAEEYKIRKELIEKKLIESIIIIPRDTFYTTDISVTLWIINKDKTKRVEKINEIKKNFRDRQDEILFMDLRKWGSKYEKKYIELTDKDIDKIVKNFKSWQLSDYPEIYKNIPEFCYSATLSEVRENDYSLIPSKYIEFVPLDSGLEYEKEMLNIQKTFKDILKDEKKSQDRLIKAFKELGYDL